nr:translation initiation factor IF-2-like [Anser cygnoides]
MQPHVCVKPSQLTPRRAAVADIHQHSSVVSMLPSGSASASGTTGLKSSGETRDGSAQSAVSPGSERQPLKPPGPAPSGCQTVAPHWSRGQGPAVTPGSRKPSAFASLLSQPRAGFGFLLPSAAPRGLAPAEAEPGSADGAEHREEAERRPQEASRRAPRARWHRWQLPRRCHAAVTPSSPQEACGRRTPTPSQSTAGAAAGGGGEQQRLRQTKQQKSNENQNKAAFI